MVKRSLESLAAELATLRIPASNLRKLESLLIRLSEPHLDSTLKELVRIDQDFHYILHLASMNQPLTQMLENIHYRCPRGWFHFIDRIPELQEPVVANLPEVLDALKRRQPAQARAIERLTKEAWDKMDHAIYLLGTTVALNASHISSVTKPKRHNAMPPSL